MPQILDSQALLNKVFDSGTDRLKVDVGGASVTVEASDIQIGAVELKNATTDDRAIINASGQLFIKASELETILAAIRDTAGIKKITDALPSGTNMVGKVRLTDGTTDVSIDTTGGFNAVPVVTAMVQNQVEIMPLEAVVMNVFSTTVDTQILGYVSNRLFIESSGAASIEVFYSGHATDFPASDFETVVFSGAGFEIAAADVPGWAKYVKVRPSANVDITLDVFRSK